MDNIIHEFQDFFKELENPNNNTNVSIVDDIFDNKSKHKFDFASQLSKNTGGISGVIMLIGSFGILVITAIFGNILVCHVIFKNRKMHTVTNIFIANMAISDLLLVLLNVPLHISRHLMQEWVLGTFLCHLLSFSLMVSSYVSTFTLMAIALDRQRVLLYPLHPRITKRKGFIILFWIWLFAIALSLPFGIFNTVEEMNFVIVVVKRCGMHFPDPKHQWEQYLTVITIVLQYIIPLTIIAVTYVRIVHKLWLRTHLGFVTEKQRATQIKAKRKSIRLLVSVVIVFAICWMPLNLYHLLTDLHPNTKLFHYNSTVFFICHWIAISSSCINPFVYCWMNPTFRSEVKNRFTCCSTMPRNDQAERDIDEQLLQENFRFVRRFRNSSSFRESGRTDSCAYKYSWKETLTNDQNGYVGVTPSLELSNCAGRLKSPKWQNEGVSYSQDFIIGINSN